MIQYTIGEYAFFGGVTLAVILGIMAGLFPTILVGGTGFVLAALIILGFIVGISHINMEHAQDLLIAVIALLLIDAVVVKQVIVLVAYAGTTVSLVYQNLLIFIASAALIVALRQLSALGSRTIKKRK